MSTALQARREKSIDSPPKPSKNSLGSNRVTHPKHSTSLRCDRAAINGTARADHPGTEELAPTFAWKRALDLAILTLSLPILLPLMLAVACWVRLVSGGSVLFRQERIGCGGKPFTIFKFRSMAVNAASDTHEQHVARLIEEDCPMTKLDILGDPRVIKGGLLLRMAGLDELPQVINVLRGEMSIVGPRPCVPKEFGQFGPHQRRRFEVLPGLTGYWQISGKNRTTFSEMVAMDEHYADQRSLMFDLRILVTTPFVVAGQVVECVKKRIAARWRRADLGGTADNAAWEGSAQQVRSSSE